MKKIKIIITYLNGRTEVLFKKYRYEFKLVKFFNELKNNCLIKNISWEQC